MKLFRQSSVWAFAFTSVLGTAPTSASLIGDTVQFTTNLGFGPITEVVEDGVVEYESLSSRGEFHLDWEEESIQVIFASSFAFGGIDWLFTSLDWIGMPNGIITGIDVTTTGQSTPTSSFGDHSVTLGFDRQSYLQGETIDIALTTSHDVPAPATLALFGFGLAGLGWSKRKKP
jgi:hypothetical protein